MPAPAPIPDNAWQSMPVSNATPRITARPSPAVNGNGSSMNTPARPAHHVVVPAGLRPIPAPVETVIAPPPASTPAPVVVSAPPVAPPPPSPQPLANPTPVAIITPATVAASPTEALTLDRASLAQLLLELVSDRTGYPTEMLKLDQDLEAELGIDSIKRVEILGALQEKLSGSIAGQVQQQMERFTSAKSLDNILDQLLALLPDSATQGTEVNGLGKR